MPPRLYFFPISKIVEVDSATVSRPSLWYFANLNNVTLFQMITFRFGPEKEDVLKRKDDFEAVKNIHFKD